MSHINHLYEDVSLSFRDLKKILKQVSNGEIVGTEKTDGINILLSYNIPQERVKIARSKTDVINGGIDVYDLLDKFSHNPEIGRSLEEAVQSFQEFCENINPQILLTIFGESNNFYYNFESIDPDIHNIIKYSGKYLVLHETGNVAFDLAKKQIKDVEISEGLANLKLCIENSKKTVNFKLVNDQPRKTILSNKAFLDATLEKLEAIQRQFKVDNNETIFDFLYVNFKFFLKNEGINITPGVSKKILSRICGEKGIKLNQALAEVDVPSKEKIRNLLDRSTEVLKILREPIESIIHDFSVELLKEFKSSFVTNDDEELLRIQNRLSKAIKDIRNSKNKIYIDILNQQFKKIKSSSNITSASEGFVFLFKNKFYKFTGNYAPLNQILGILRFGRAGHTALQNFMKPSARNRVIVILPGSFKPPHVGHYYGAKYFSEIPTVDEVQVIISSKPRASNKGLQFTSEQSCRIWEIFVKNDPKVKIISSTEDSPIKDVFNRLSEMNPGDTVVLGLGQKDSKDDRYNELMEWPKQNGSDIKVKISTSNVGNYGNISSRDIREFIHKKDRHSFYKFLPPHLTTEDKEEIFNLLINGTCDVKKNDNTGSKSVKRAEIMNEILLRERIQTLIERFFHESQEPNVDHVELLKEHIRKIILLEKTNVPNDTYFSTGINVLEDLLRKIVPQVESDYKSLTSSKSQRDSFKLHILNAINKSLTIADMNKKSSEAINARNNVETHEEEPSKPAPELPGDDLSVQNEADGVPDGEPSTPSPEPSNSKFIDIDDSDEEQKLNKQLKNNGNDFEIPTQDKTGRNIAKLAYAKIEKAIVGAYILLEDEKDQKLFYDYLIANLRLYFDKFESELGVQ